MEPANIARLAALAWCILLSAVSLAAAQDEAAAFDRRDSDELLTMEGVWRSRGYGWWWVVEGERIETFDAGTGYCDKRRRHWGLPGQAGEWMLLSKDRQTIKLTLGEDSYLHTFDKVASLPAACQVAADSGGVAIFDAAAAIFTAHYAFFRQRGVDWAAHVTARRQHIQPELSESGLFRELTALLEPLDDGHVGLEGMVGGRRVQYEPPLRPRPLSPDARRNQAQFGYWSRDVGLELAGEDRESIGDGRIQYGLVDKEIGYLYVASTGRSLRAALDGPLDEARDLFRGARALVIDLTKNFGGSDPIARRFASRFARTRTLAYYKYAGDAEQAVAQPVYVEPSDDRLFDGPIYVITGASTISAAEVLVMCLRALPNVTHIGAARRGSLSDVLEKRLPNGWTVSLSNEVYLDHERTGWEGKGIAPHIAFPVEDKAAEPLAALRAARGILRYVLALPPRRRTHRKSRS